MQAGDYNQYFEIAEVTHAIDECGQQTPEYRTVFRGYAKVTNLTGREYWDAFSVQQENTLQFYTRWHDALTHIRTTEHVLFWQGMTLDITSVDNVAYGNRFCVIKARIADDGQGGRP